MTTPFSFRPAVFAPRRVPAANTPAGAVRALDARLVRELVDEALSAVLAEDRALLARRLGVLRQHLAPQPALRPLAAQRLQFFVDCELYRVHVGASIGRLRMARELRAVVGLDTPAKPAS